MALVHSHRVMEAGPANTFNSISIQVVEGISHTLQLRVASVRAGVVLIKLSRSSYPGVARIIQR